MTIVFFVLGLAALIVGAEMLVRGASKLAVSFGVSPLTAGLTVVAFGTSSPELAVSVQSAYAGKVDIELGNVVGSNIFNVLFILGAAALIAPLIVVRQIIRQEVPIMIAATVLLFVLALDDHIGRVDGLLMFAALIVYTLFLIIQSRRAVASGDHSGDDDIDMTSTWDRHWAVQLLLVGAGLVLLVLGANWLVDAAIEFARTWGVSELVIGLTIVAAGTSLPEVATSLLASLRGQRDIAVGNVIGSNIFNILGVLGLAGIVAPVALPVAPSMLTFDMLVMLAVALACLPMFFTGRALARWEGGVFLGYYAAYTTYLLLAAQQHDALPRFSYVMMSFVIPLTVITLAVVMVNAINRRSEGS